MNDELVTPTTSVADNATEQLANRFFTASEDGELDTVRECDVRDAAIRHHDDGRAQHRDGNLRALTWSSHNPPGRRSTDVRRRVTADGFVPEHVFRPTDRAGEAIELAACIEATVGGGRITRLDEYLDAAATARVIVREDRS